MTEDDMLIAARAALQDLSLPDGSPLMASDRVAGPVRVGDRLSLAIAISADEFDDYASLRDAAEAALRAVPGAGAAIVALTADKPAPPAPVSAPGQATQSSGASAATMPGGKRPQVLDGVRHVVAVASGKGGVGKSTTAVNLALGLRTLGLKVGILDADIHGPSLPTLLALHGRPRLGPNRRLLPMQAHGLAAMSMGLMVDAETAMIWRGPMVMSAITQMLSDVDWGQLDILIVDMPPGTGDAQLAIAQGTDLSGAVIVSTPQDLALIDARRGIAMFRKVDVPILGVIENMAYFVCTECGTNHELFGRGGARAEAERLGVPYLGAVPLTMDLRAASDAGRPVVARAPDSDLGRIYTGMAEAVWATLDDTQPASGHYVSQGA